MYVNDVFQQTVTHTPSRATIYKMMKQTYQLQPGVGDHHLVLLVLEGTEGESINSRENVAIEMK